MGWDYNLVRPLGEISKTLNLGRHDVLVQTIDTVRRLPGVVADDTPVGDFKARTHSFHGQLFAL